MKKEVILLLLFAATMASAQDETMADDQKKPLFDSPA